MDSFLEGLTSELVFYPEHGFGFYPVEYSGVYNDDYFKKYQSYSDTEFADMLNKARVCLVNKHYAGNLVDIGIGAGDFVKRRPSTYGFDVNPTGVEWLKSKNLWCDPYAGEVRAISCWDSLEHIEEPGKLLEKVKEYVFVSIPIFDNAEHILRSKHFRKDEHLWYFTHKGLIKLMAFYGFDMLEFNQMETDIGREGINSYVFKRG